MPQIVSNWPHFFNISRGRNSSDPRYNYSGASHPWIRRFVPKVIFPSRKIVLPPQKIPGYAPVYSQVLLYRYELE